MIRNGLRLTNSPQVTASLALDAGSYVFLANARALGNAVPANVSCYIDWSGAGGSQSFPSNVNVGVFPDRKILSMSGAATVPAGSVDVVCSDLASDGSVDTVTLNAIKVGAVTTR